MNPLEQTSHRPFPFPKRPWLMTQTWHDVLFAHWTVPADDLAAHLPGGLTLDLYEGQAWIGLVPFGMSNVRLRGIIGFPTTTAFRELNVRTYVMKDGVPGVWFFSLDAASALVVYGARLFFHLPYFRAHMTLQEKSPWVDYDSRRVDSWYAATDGPAGADTPVFRARYRPTQQVAKGPLEHWLTERYCLYASNGRHLFRGDIHHLPWLLHSAEAVIEENTMLSPLEIQLPDSAPLLHFSRQMDVLVWPLIRV